MDTDSAYMVLGGPLESLVKPDKRDEFYQEYKQWFPHPFWPDHKHDFLNRDIWTKSLAERGFCAAIQQYDCRTPGL